MTAISLYIADNVACAVTDAGAFDKNGRIVSHGTKTLVLPSIPMTISVAGYWNPDRLRDLLFGLCALPYPTTLLPLLPAILREYVVGLPEETRWAWGGTTLFIASFDHITGKAGAHIISAEARLGSEPFTVVDVEGGICMPGDDAITDMKFEHMQDDPWRILCAQRAMPNPFINGLFAASGWGEMFTVTADGIIGECLGQFPEQVGELVDPAREGVQVRDKGVIEWPRQQAA